MNFKNRVQKFMKGRYGPDELYNFFFFLYIVVLILNIFLKNKILSILEIIIIVIMFYRFLSNNIYSRSRENQRFLKIKKTLLSPFKNLKRNIKDKEHVYKKCSKCKTILKLPLPSKRGFNKAKCPHCKNSISLFTLKKEKIDIIINSKK